MNYRPWIGFPILAIAIVLDIMFGRTGLIFVVALGAMLLWSAEGGQA